MDLYNTIIDRSNQPFFILGPCVIESEKLIRTVAEELVRIKEEFSLNIVFKASFDKANRTSVNSFRGLGFDEGIRLLELIKREYNLPITTDIHEPYQAEAVSEVVDIIQIPAFLCRQTDLLIESAKTGKIVNIKKAQFLSAEDMRYPTEKVRSTGNTKVLLTERGTMFGYNNLVVDFRNIPLMKKLNVPVIMDCTHSVQMPGSLGGKTGGYREFVPNMALAAKAFGANGYFMEVHPNPLEALSDGPNMVFLKDIRETIIKLLD
jgi:2-dehydro-3-deoxyphosphooctonate aldolase (KDO 8-P synthase)